MRGRRPPARHCQGCSAPIGPGWKPAYCDQCRPLVQADRAGLVAELREQREIRWRDRTPEERADIRKSLGFDL